MWQCRAELGLHQHEASMRRGMDSEREAKWTGGGSWHGHGLSTALEPLPTAGTGA